MYEPPNKSFRERTLLLRQVYHDLISSFLIKRINPNFNFRLYQIKKLFPCISQTFRHIVLINGSINYLVLRHWLICYLSLIGSLQLDAQDDISRNAAGKSYPGGKTVEHQLLSGDTSIYHLNATRFQEEVLKRGELNLDTFRRYGHTAIHGAKALDDPKRLVSIYLGFASGYVEKTEIDSAFYYCRLAIDLSSSINDIRLLALSYSRLGWTYVYDHSNYDEAIINSIKAYELAKESRDTILIIDVATKLTKIYFQADQMLEAFSTCRELTSISVTRKDTVSLITNYFMFGSIYAYIGLYDKQMEMVYRLMELSKKSTDYKLLYTINAAASNGYLFKEQYDSVLYYSRINLPFCRKMNRMPYCYTNIAKAHLQMNHIDSAKYYYGLIMDHHKTYGTYIDTYLYLDLGKVEFKSGNDQSALGYYKKAESDISKPSLHTQMEIYKALYEYYDQGQENENALYYLKKYKTWSDSILNDQFGRAVLQYESSLINEQNQVLIKEKKIQTLFTARQRQEKRLAYGIIALIFIGAGLTVHRFVVLKNFRALQSLNGERLRISRELHDEVGATLSGIAMYSHVARDQVKSAKTHEAAYSLSIMEKSAGEMVNKLSDIVWLINPEQDTLLELFGRLGEYGKQMARVQNMQMHIDLPNELAGIHIPLESRRNIYLIFKEAINNAAKYSQGKVITLRVELKRSEYIFSISDDGHGFDESNAKLGNGLSNMQKRAEEMGATIKIESGQNLGTHIELKYKVTH